MGRQLRIVHRTGYRYTSPVSASHNEVRMTPRQHSGAGTSSPRDWTSRPTAWSHAFVDYWGTAVTAFEIAEPHSRNWTSWRRQHGGRR